MERVTQKPYNESSEKQQFVVFDIDGKIYGINILLTESIERMHRITRVPKSPSEITGVINLRGDIVPLLCMRKILGYKDKGYTDLTRIIIVQFEEYRIGLIVDQVHDVLTVPSDDIQLSMDELTEKEKVYISGIINMNEQPLMLIDIPKTLEKINIIDKQGV